MISTIEENNIKPFDLSVATEMDKAIKHFEKDLSSVNTGKASASMVEDLRVDCYGNMMPLRELASISIPESNLISIQPWDKSVVAHIEKAILASQLNINPQTNGTVIRLELPPMSGTRREELAKLVSKKAEDAKVAVRNVRKDFGNVIKDNEKKKNISEDFSKRLTKSLQEFTDKFIAQIDMLGEKKKKDLKTF
ncbi:ribosome recycling factor [Candidatus Chromulinivorax destructor]|uniref:Ribosome-recycling factor n=1 Tax=Candidatus Chromulinivorax destructor TaxID=2066483 RepID=A0A345ZCR7_9BACT|nr:ribosome recycling factor [Candidatus Chromulinivorax destructor]AXK61084.1 ribosome recycling factor [Candidatus Chromulinivorax destructor]